MTSDAKKALKLFENGCKSEHMHEWCEGPEMMHAPSGIFGFEFNLHEINLIRTALQSTRKPENKMNPTIQVDDYVVDAQSVRNLIEQRDVAEKKLAAMPDAVTVPREVLQGVREALKYWIDGGVDYHVGEVALASLDAVLEEGE